MNRLCWGRKRTLEGTKIFLPEVEKCLFTRPVGTKLPRFPLAGKLGRASIPTPRADCRPSCHVFYLPVATGKKYLVGSIGAGEYSVIHIAKWLYIFNPEIWMSRFRSKRNDFQQHVLIPHEMTWKVWVTSPCPTVGVVNNIDDDKYTIINNNDDSNR